MGPNNLTRLTGLLAIILTINLTAFPVGQRGGTWQEPANFWQLPDHTQPVLRLHVMANSDLAEDQQFKNRVVEIVQQLFTEEIVRQQQEHGNEVPVFTEVELSSLETELKDKIAATGSCAASIQLNLTEERFPLRAYGSKVYPPGEYKALKVVIGEGRGENWWCLLFPTLCFPLAVEENKTDELIVTEGSNQSKEADVKAREEDFSEKEQRGWKFLLRDLWGRWLGID